MNSVYRRFETTDITALLSLMFQLGYRHTEESLLGNVASVRQSGGEIFVAEDAGSVCGCVAAIVDTRLAAGVHGEIVSVVVDHAHRGQGFGKGLVRCAESWLAERVSRIRIRANSKREQAHRFYREMGYSLSKSQVVLIKELS